MTVNKVSRLIETSLPRASVWTALQENLEGQMDKMTLSFESNVGPLKEDIFLDHHLWSIFQSSSLHTYYCSDLMYLVIFKALAVLDYFLDLIQV